MMTKKVIIFMQYVSFAQPVSQGIVDCVEYLYIYICIVL